MAGHLVSSPVSGFHTILEPGPLLEPGSTCDGVTRWQLIIKHDLTNLFHGRTLGVGHSVRFPHRCQKLAIDYKTLFATSVSRPDTYSVLPNVPVPHRFGTGPLVEPGSTCEWSQKVAIEYKT